MTHIDIIFTQYCYYRIVQRGPVPPLSPVSSFQGSNTLPRAGAKKNKVPGGQGGSVDDSEIVITKKLTGTGSSVRIRIGGSARSPTENIEKVSDSWVEQANRVAGVGDLGGLAQAGSGPGTQPAIAGKISRTDSQQQQQKLPRFGEIFVFLIQPVCGE